MSDDRGEYIAEGYYRPLTLALGAGNTSSVHQGLIKDAFRKCGLVLVSTQESHRTNLSTGQILPHYYIEGYYNARVHNVIELKTAIEAEIARLTGGLVAR